MLATASTAPSADTSHARAGDRRKVRLQGRLKWRDAAGVLRFASVVTQDVSDCDAFVECQVPASIPMYRLVHFQLERNGVDCADVPAALRRGQILSAIYRVAPCRAATGTPQGYALRLLVEPEHAPMSRSRQLATAMAH